jgi:lipoprotein NlpD
VGLESGQGWRDLQRWNGIDNPNLIEVGQVLRVVPPGVDPSAPAPRPVTTAKVEARPLEARPPAAPASGSPVVPAVAAPSAPSAAPAPAPVTAAPAARDADDDINWMWPANGAVVGPFDDPRVKGLVIGGKAGDAVMAAADGRVIYAGSGIRGYGNLVIVKHNTNYLTAYGHNQTLLVKEDQVVRRGQKIAEMGSSDAERVQLHFEIRRQGKPLDPAKLLPQR